MTLKRPNIIQNFTMSNTSQASAKLSAQTRRVLVSLGSTGNSGANAFILFGDSTGLTVSSSNGTMFPVQWCEEFDTQPGQTFYTISQTTQTSGVGVMSLTELT